MLDIVEGTSVDGPGLRTSIYFAGCHHACPGCHNPLSWDVDGGREMTVDQLMDVVRDNDFDVTFSGGDPLYQPIDQLTELARRIVDAGHTVWLYTGFVYDDIKDNPRYNPVLQYVDTVVDGPFVQALRDTQLRFRGSSNQRIIKLKNDR